VLSSRSCCCQKLKRCSNCLMRASTGSLLERSEVRRKSSGSLEAKLRICFSPSRSKLRLLRASRPYKAGERPVEGGAGIGVVDSNAPMSHAAPCGRPTPRWSLAGGGQGPPPSMAALTAFSAMVCVGPPLFASPPSLGSELDRSPVAPNPQSLVLWRL
jgi:hypothetical protein